MDFMPSIPDQNENDYYYFLSGPVQERYPNNQTIKPQILLSIVSADKNFEISILANKFPK